MDRHSRFGLAQVGLWSRAVTHTWNSTPRIRPGLDDCRSNRSTSTANPRRIRSTPQSTQVDWREIDLLLRGSFPARKNCGVRSFLCSLARRNHRIPQHFQRQSVNAHHWVPVAASESWRTNLRFSLGVPGCGRRASAVRRRSPSRFLRNSHGLKLE
jgi:hypothetical protein